jgi:hypothetical protein
MLDISGVIDIGPSIERVRISCVDANSNSVPIAAHSAHSCLEQRSSQNNAGDLPQSGHRIGEPMQAQPVNHRHVWFRRRACALAAVTAVPFRGKECQVRGGGLSVCRPDLRYSFNEDESFGY